MFECESITRDGKIIKRMVYAVEVRDRVTMFLVYSMGWVWMEADYYKPIEKKKRASI